MINTKVSVADILFGLAAPTNPSLRNKIIGFIALQRLAVTLLIIPPLLGLVALAGGQFTDPRLVVAFVGAWLISAAAMITNDVVDAERDKQKWPLRPLPSGLISKSTATLYAVVVTIIALVLAVVVFNWLSAAIVLLIVVVAYAYVRYLRDTVGFFTVTLPLAIVPLAVWAAFSPQNILTPLPWLLATFFIGEGIAQNITNEASDPAIPAFFVRPRPSRERVIYIIAIVITFLTGTMIFVYAQLLFPYMLVLIAITAWALIQARYLGEPRDLEKLTNAYMILTMHNIIFWLNVAVFVWIK